MNFLIKPPEEKEEEIPEWLKKKGPDEQGGKGKRHKGEEGKMGKKTSKNKEGLYGLKGPKDNPDPHLAKKLAEENAKNAGILGVLKMNEGSHLASIFGRDTAAGSDAVNVLGGLIGNEIGEAYGVGGLGLVGTGTARRVQVDPFQWIVQIQPGEAASVAEGTAQNEVRQLHFGVVGQAVRPQPARPGSFWL